MPIIGDCETATAGGRNGSADRRRWPCRGGLRRAYRRADITPMIAVQSRLDCP